MLQIANLVWQTDEVVLPERQDVETLAVADLQQYSENAQTETVAITTVAKTLWCWPPWEPHMHKSTQKGQFKVYPIADG